MIYLKTPEEIEQMRAACDLTSRTLAEMAKWVMPGVTTHKIDSVAKEFILDNGGRPSCLGYGGFPGAVCVEVNEVPVELYPQGG
jgi:methionyl aminopeptidase